MSIVRYVLAHFAWVLLAAGIVGTAMGVNRTLKIKEQEHKGLQFISGLSGAILLSAALFLVATGMKAGLSGYTVQLVTVLGLSLLARPLERVPAAMVFALLLAAAVVLSLGHGGFPELFQRTDVRRLAILAGLAILAMLVLILSTVEKFVDLALNILGLGPIVTTLSLIGFLHAYVLITSGDQRGLLRYL